MRVVKGSGAFNEALLLETPPLLHPTTILLCLCTLVGFFCQTMNGFDGSLFGGLLANKTFLDHFHGENDGIWAGLVSSMYQIGGVCALPFVGPAIDTWGRRAGMFIGSILIILGTIVTGLTLQNASAGQFMGGRFLLGFGVSIASAAGPIYVVETSHPAFRGVVTAYCNTFWFVGSILASGAVRGAINITGNSSWQIPVWLQMLFSGLIAISAFFLPESPRWLYVNGKREQANAFLHKWHGYGNPDSAWVKLQLAEYDELLNLDGAVRPPPGTVTARRMCANVRFLQDKRWWDYRALFKNGASRYRVLCNCGFALFGQWAGNSVLSFFLSAVLDTAGYHDSVTQTNIILAYACFQFAFALAGAAFVDRIGRRPLMLFSMSSCCLTWIAMSTATGIYSGSGDTNVASAQAAIAFIFIFGAVYSVGITPLQALYPVEVLSYEMRAKGMAFCSLATNAGGLLGQFAWPVALKNIGWKTYLIFIIWDAAQAAIMYFAFPETRKRTVCHLSRPTSRQCIANISDSLRSWIIFLRPQIQSRSL